MSNLVIEGREIPLDKEGFLRNLEDWSPEVAEALAAQENIELTEDHWDVIRLLQAFYTEFELSPAMRPLVKYVGQNLGPEKGRSIFLMKLFPPSPAKIGSKIAGLPKPTNCL
ncbi:TusE/DsrC/DsvC family sulfur relay protein [Microbulbifer hydrolyticus]|uniref:Sulfurtransferase n=1 Tax=Microbulbifer hydrolyticus TaxID=48074 RepID=A0A6P1TB09_9GAMM|nr:TusE/DsrC/DsvC family sulfur relay protein [Microbulbifer hydrolyticus]MBB5210305.1 tRNA 2-thiouridine synthesizing protein E [Microbulbifer hydrolyticus]QHQ39197.1 TusE/DsrC/DsvC family sulfur relay protein [Microbulbifer hydrolyticus]